MNLKTFALFAAIALPLAPAVAQAPAAAGETAMEAKVPVTADDHTAVAKTYESKAAEWRKEAAFHRQMAAAYKASHADMKGGVKNTEAAKMEKHCMAIVKDAEKLAGDAEWAAKYHNARAKELAGH